MVHSFDMATATAAAGGDADAGRRVSHGGGGLVNGAGGGKRYSVEESVTPAVDALPGGWPKTPMGMPNGDVTKEQPERRRQEVQRDHQRRSTQARCRGGRVLSASHTQQQTRAISQDIDCVDSAGPFGCCHEQHPSQVEPDCFAFDSQQLCAATSQGELSSPAFK
jgi:hypothetical protein